MLMQGDLKIRINDDKENEVTKLYIRRHRIIDEINIGFILRKYKEIDKKYFIIVFYAS